jgi:hypothetical protein
MRGGMLVGVITRAAYPSPRIACGDLTRWAAVTVSGSAGEVATSSIENDTPAAEPRGRKVRRHAHRGEEAETRSAGLFGNWFSEKVEARRSARRSSRHKITRR